MDAVGAPFNNEFLKDTIEVDAQVFIEFGNNRFNDGQVCTASSTKSARVNDTGLGRIKKVMDGFWEAAEAFNNKDVNSMKWLVCDAGSAITAEETGSGYRCIDLDNKGDYEYGWWSQTKSHATTGIFTSPEWVQSIFKEDNGSPYERTINKITLHLMKGYPNMKQVKIEYRNAALAWITVVNNYTLAVDEYELEHDLLEDTVITGLRATINSTRAPGDYARVSELNGRYVVDVTDRLMNMNISETKEEYSGPVPIGITGANTISLELENTDMALSSKGENSPYSQYVGSNCKIMPYFIVAGIRSSQGVFWSDDWNEDGTGVSVSVSGRDFSKFLQDDNREVARCWQNVTADVPFLNLLMELGFDPENFNVSLTSGRKYSILYVKDQSPWEFMGDLALAERATFYFGHKGGFNLKPGERPYTINIHDDPYLWTYSDTTNITAASSQSEIYTNKVTVKVSDLAPGNHGITVLWSPESPCILSYSRLQIAINSTDTTFHCEREVRMETDPPQAPTFGWPDYDGIIFIPTFNGAGTCTGGELVKYDHKDDFTFFGCERGYLNTVAAGRLADTYLGEAREWDIEYNNAPALSVKQPFVIAIDDLAIPAVQGWPQAHIPIFTYDNFKAHLVVANIEKFQTWLAGDYISVSAFDAKQTDDKISFGTSISGKVATNSGAKQKVVRKQKDIEALDQNHIRRYGLNKLTIENKWILNRTHAQSVADDFIEQYSSPRMIIDIEAISPPSLNLGDRVYISTLEQMNIFDRDFEIISAQYDYTGDLNVSLTLRECKTQTTRGRI